MDDPTSSSNNKTLKQIYHALELRQYSKAYKLTLTKPTCDWPLVIALRAHALERSGKVSESLTILRDLIYTLFASNSKTTIFWRDEIEDKLWARQQLEELMTVSQTSDTIIIHTTTAGHKTSTTNHGAAAHHQSTVEEEEPWTLMDILDMTRWQRWQRIQSSTTHLSHTSPSKVAIVGGIEAILHEVC